MNEPSVANRYKENIMIANTNALLNQAMHIASDERNERLLKVIGKASEVIEELTILRQLTEQEQKEKTLKAIKDINR
jgi:hypothetical protein